MERSGDELFKYIPFRIHQVRGALKGLWQKKIVFNVINFDFCNMF